ncbi:DUF5691 domain-containing protein [Nocardiopsis gilva]|uniref:DUF5691 domain-containing protein n=2 Tax=Nocardiopsis gilva TaxID=280236 RepID=UPI0039EE1D64
MTNTWPELVSTALVGTARRAVPGASGVPASTADDPALALLDHAALVAVRDRAGRCPARVAALEPAPPETRPAVSAAAARRLDRLTSAERAPQLREWLALVADRGLRVPPEALPDLLERGARDHAFGRLVLAVSGERGRWLARLNPDWSYLERLVPPGEFTADEWRRESVERRRALLESLDDRLSPADEPLLTEALTDRSTRVRALAMALLARLPDTAHGRHLAAHARRHVLPGEHGRLSVRLPDLADTELARDLNVTAPADGDPRKEIRREWLWTLISHTPLDTWVGHLGTDRAEVVREVSGSGDLADALANAAVVQRDLDWARLLLPTVLDRLTRGHDLRGSRGPALLALLPAAEQCAWAVRQARADRASASHLLNIVEQLDCPWTEELGAIVVDTLLGTKAGAERTTSAYTQLAAAAERWLLPTLHTRFAEYGAPADAGEGTGSTSADSPESGDDRKGRTLARLAATLRFRYEMHEELN